MVIVLAVLLTLRNIMQVHRTLVIIIAVHLTGQNIAQLYLTAQKIGLKKQSILSELNS